MNTLQTDIAIVTAILWLMAIAVVAYDRIKYRKLGLNSEMEV